MATFHHHHFRVCSILTAPVTNMNNIDTRLNRDGMFSKLYKAIEIAKSAGDEQELLNSLWSIWNMLVSKSNFTKEASSEDSETCKRIEKETYLCDWEGLLLQGKVKFPFQPEMLCGQVQGQFLKSLVSVHRAKRVLEAGMFTGYSALCMAEALPENGEILTLDSCDYLVPLVKSLIRTSPHNKKIKIKLGDCMALMHELADAGEKFDIIFLDGPKEFYIPQIQVAFDKGLLNVGGTVIVDNAYVLGTAYAVSATDTTAQEIVDFFNGRSDLHRVMLPLNDGVLMVRRLSDVERKAVGNT